jgi:hypothetical protein
MRKILWNYNSFILNFLYKLNYRQFEIFSAFMSLSTCSLMILSIRYIEDGILFDRYKQYIYIVGISHLIILGMIIINWLSFTIFKRANFSLEERGLKRIFNTFSLLLDGEIFPFIWNFIFGFLAILHKHLYFMYALQLFTIFNIFPTMSSVLYAVRIRYKQFLSTGFLLIILILFYSSVTFYFFRDGLYNEEIKENICETFLQCFLYLINYGIRTGSGVGFGIKGFNQKGYWSEFIFDWIFYFSIILIMINIINGIIVDTFQALREANNERDDVRENVCFICSLNRAKFEIKGINFENHRIKEHNILNYFEYLIKIKMTDEHDLNSLDFEVLNAVIEQRTDFFPVKKAKCFESTE